MDGNYVRMISQSTIIEKYGLTRALIQKYLPEPTLRPNHFCRANPVKTWPEYVVQDICEREDVKRALKKAQEQGKIRLLYGAD